MEKAVSFFEEEIPRRSPKGKFVITRQKQNMPDIRKGTLLVFSYRTQCIYIARSAGPVIEENPRSKSYDPKWPAYLVVDMDSLEPANARLLDYEKALRKETDHSGPLVQTRGWPLVDEKHEGFTLKFFCTPPKPRPALDDLDPPLGNTAPDRALSTRWTYLRDHKVRKEVLRRAKGCCEFCNERGFLLPSGRRFLEAHHIIALADDGADTPQNVIALCPNHHREAHYGEAGKHLESEMIKLLRMKYPKN